MSGGVKITELPEYQEYVSISALYSWEKREYPKFVELGLDKSINREDRMRAFERKEQNSKICKAYYAAKKKYRSKLAQIQLREKGMEHAIVELVVDDVTIAETCGFQIPTSMKDIVRDREKEAIAEKYGTPEFLAELSAARVKLEAEEKPFDIEEEMRLAEQAERGNAWNLGTDEVEGDSDE